MHQTTVRFGPDLWEALEAECAKLGVSVAQYLREAALTRLVYAAGRRGDRDFERALGLVAPSGLEEAGVTPEATPASSAEKARATSRALRETNETAAVAAQSRLARQRAQELRARARAQKTH